jgi:tetratricopeptide (TPR) repeat protein
VRHVDAVQERETWSGRFQGSTSELFDIQDRVASALIQGLQRDLGQTLRQPLVAEGTASMEAYNLYLKGKFHAGRRNPQDMKLGLKYLEEAVAEDPNFADAHAEIADLCSVMGWYELMEPKLGWQRGEVAAQRALTINSQLPDAHVALGTVRSFFYWDWEGARREFECALELNRNHARAHFRLGVNYLVPTGQLREAVVSIKEALRFDPLSALYHTILGTFYDCMDLNELAIRSHEQALEIDPHQAMALWGLGRVYARLKDYDRAQKTFEKCVEIAPTFRYLGALAQCHAFSGNEAKAREMLGTMLRKPGVERAQFPLGSVYLALGQKEEAIQCFRYELERRNPAAIWIGVEPFFRPLRGDPRFLDCCQEIGLTIA